MSDRNGEPPDHGEQRSASARLDSWKEIASYLRRSVSTVQRWEKSEGLPVHRHRHQRQGSVYAYAAEVDAWWAARRSDLEAEDAATADGVPAAAAVPPLRRRSRLVLGSAISLAVLVVIVVVARIILAPPDNGTESTARRMIAVLPFDNLSGDPDQEYLSDGLTDEVTTRLARVDYDILGVIARTSSMQYKSAPRNIGKLGGELGVDLVLEGSFRRAEDRVWVNARLIHVEDSTHLWAESYESTLSDMFTLQIEIADRIVRELAPEILDSMPMQAEMNSAAPTAYEAYLKGRYFWNQRSTDGLRKAVEYFDEATGVDPDYAPAWAGLADAHSMLSISVDVVPAPTARERAVQAAERAVDLDPMSPEAYASLGLVRYRFDWDWTGCEQAFRKAMTYGPSYASAFQWYGVYLTQMGRFEEAAEVLSRARHLDPISPIIHVSSGLPHQYAGEYDEAVELYEKAIDLDPQLVLAHRVLGNTLRQRGDLEEAVVVLERAREMARDDPHAIADLGCVYAAAGRTADSRRTLIELEVLTGRRHVTPYDFAVVHACLGDREQALTWLERAHDEHATGLVYINVDPLFDALRAEPRFQELLKRLRLPAHN